ncbi:Receptor-like protein EIX2 [Bienertia sinuspersici]
MISYSTMKTSHRNLIFLLEFYILSYCKYNAVGITSISNTSNHINYTRCIPYEREALLRFKHDILVDHCRLLTTWGDQQDCCQWQGVQCDSNTNRVTMLTLRGSHSGMPCLEGEIPHQLKKLVNLVSLDLTCDFGNSYDCPYANTLWWLPKLTLLRDINLSGLDLSLASDDWFQNVNNLPSLRVLHMDQCGLSPMIPASISYTNSSSNISIINLSNNFFNDTSVFQWLFRLSGTNSSLVVLELSNNQIPGPIPPNFGEMLSLSYLDLSSNLLDGTIPSAFWNMHNISYLSLGMNQLEGPIPHTISNLNHLTHLILPNNNFQGSGNFPNSLGSLCSLQEINLNNNNLDDDFPNIIQALSGCATKSLVSLDLSQNRVWGSIPEKISIFASLRGLLLNTNQLNGTIGHGIGQLSMLETLDLSYNSLTDTLFHSHFSNLSRLHVLDLSNNPDLNVSISANWIPPFQLINVNLESCKLGPSFPNWLATQTNVSYLGISNAEISDTIPSSFWNSLSSHNLEYLNISYNMIHGVLPDLPITFHKRPVIDLSSNNVSGAIPSFLRNTPKLYLNNNRLSVLNPFFCPKDKTSIIFLNLANNLFSGELPDCWMSFDQLLVLHLENNNFSGKLPTSVGALTQLYTLHLRNNSLSGELPRSLDNCTSLVVLDLGYNSFTGHIPAKIGCSFESLRVLSLQSNRFHGGLPLSLCQLSHLQVLDISINHISGILPKCIYNFTAMIKTDDSLSDIDVSSVYTYYAYSEYARLMWKRKEQSFQRSLGQMRAIDISNNELKGLIPAGISSLTGLVFLNLSNNDLSGSIPSRIGQLTSLEFLDLSNNHLSGDIPTSLSQVTTLGILDLANNNLSGKIPVGTQLQSFDSSSYMSNPGLCGAPLSKCPGGQPTANELDSDKNDTQQDEDDSSNLVLGLCISVVIGFIIGFWGVCGTLAIKTSWRQALFKFLDDQKTRFFR